jgi:carbamoyl-phosphate synthase, small subunit
MIGYQETMTDPSYRRQIVCATAPQIGNTGWNDEDDESRGSTIWVSGLIIRDLSACPSNWRSKRSLDEEMASQGIIGIKNVDTRALVRHLRDKGSVNAGIFTGDEAAKPVDELLSIVNEIPSMAGQDLAEEVSTDEPYIVEPEGTPSQSDTLTVVAYDMGIKTNTPRNFSRRGIKTVVVQANTSFDDIQKYNPDGVFISNGPGDPSTADTMVDIVRQVLSVKIPFFGICFGNQIFGRALGLGTYKLKFGHRGINVPVVDVATGRVSITAQNHGFALLPPHVDDASEKLSTEELTASFDTPFGPAHVTHICPNDNVVEGVALNDGRAFSVQYHPEAAAGPHDANPLFDQFVTVMQEGKAK